MDFGAVLENDEGGSGEDKGDNSADGNKGSGLFPAGVGDFDVVVRTVVVFDFATAIGLRITLIALFAFFLGSFFAGLGFFATISFGISNLALGTGLITFAGGLDIFITLFTGSGFFFRRCFRGFGGRF